MVTPVDSEDHVVGNPSAGVTIIVYCDFECPYCGRAYAMIKDIRRQYVDHIRLAFRHFPLAEKHPLAQQAAEASEAAASQGQFWAMHDVLFEHQRNLRGGDLHNYAELIGLDVHQFKDELRRRVHAPRIMRDVLSGRRNGVSGTPTFFLNEALFTDEERFLRHVEETLNMT